MRAFEILCWHCLFLVSILVPFASFHCGGTMHWLSKHHISSVPWGVSKLQRSNLMFFSHGWWTFSWHGRVMPFQNPSPPDIFPTRCDCASSLWEGQPRAFEIVFFFGFRFGTIFWFPFWKPYALAERASNLKCSMGRSQATGV